MLRSLTPALLPLFLVGALGAQEPASTNPFDSVAAAHQEWQGEFGSSWRLNTDSATGAAQHLWGGSAPAEFQPESDVEWFELARMAVDRAAGMFRIDENTLVPLEVHALTLAQIGTTAKTAVLFEQRVQGVRVAGGSVSLIFGPNAELLSIDTTGLPGLGGMTVTPASSSMAAVAAAHREFVALEGREANRIEQPELVVYQHRVGKSVAGRLAWSIALHTDVLDGVPSGRRVFVAADSGRTEILGADQLVHHQDVIGHVDSNVSPSPRPNHAGNPPVLKPMRFLNVTSPAGNATTDVNGDFVIPGAGGGAVNVTARYTGPYANVVNTNGSNYSLTNSFTGGVPGSMAMNAPPSAQVTAQSNAFDGVIDFREYLKSIDPAENSMDFSVLANVNINSSCNAYYNGSSINFYIAAGGCVNTAYNTVVAHEEGHWANDREGSGNGGDGFGEGNADVYGMYIYDSPIVGQDFFGQGGGNIRTGLNTRQFCGDSNGGCYGEVHADGEVLMGALWKVRRNLNNTLGNAAGDLVADTLFVNWMNAYNDGQIRTIIEEHWLVLDDDNGNIDDGTPNYADIDAGFQEQGFPGYDLQFMSIDHVALGNTTSEAGPYVVDATVASLLGANITGAEVHYQVDGGPDNVLAMGNVGGNDWSTGIPGQVSPAFVTYWIEADDDQGNTGRNPRDGEYEFIVGMVVQHYFNDFEGATDEGWVHAQVATQDDWQRDTPQGLSTDPSGAYSGTKVWANDVGRPGWNGEYAANVNNYLLSPAIDLSAATGTRLRFRRWLGVEKRNAVNNLYDQARIKVNGVVRWENPLASDLLDNGWQLFDLDISQWADGNAAVSFRFELISDAGLQYGGWNIDDFEIIGVEPVGNTDVIVLTGPSSANVGQSLTYSYTGAPASAQVWLARSFNLNGSSFFGHAFDLGTPLAVVASGTASATGAGSWTVGPVPAGASGLTVHLEVAAKKAAEVADSNVITLTVN
ncbi:MAG TPA: hypothetical protein VGC54_12510 [Planctomycetota bacterium]